MGQIDASGLADVTDATVAVRLAGFDADDAKGELPARIVSRRYFGVVELLNVSVSGAEELVRIRPRCGVLPPSVRDIWLSLRKFDVLVFEQSRENA